MALIVRSWPTGEILLIERALSEIDPWSGHLALPGGRREEGDASLLSTAVRETFEETGVDLSASATLIGRLSTVAPRNPELPVLTVVPFVFSLTRTVEARPRAGEVAEVLWTPVERLQDPAYRSVHRHRATRSQGEASLAFPAIDLGGRTVWGLTHRILEDFLARIR